MIRFHITALLLAVVMTGTTEARAESDTYEATHDPEKELDFSDVEPPIEALGNVRIEPVYPERQVSKCVEGFVEVEFDIETDGRVSNVRIIQSEPPGAFDKSAMNAVTRWRYDTRKFEEGELPKKNVRTKLTYELTFDCIPRYDDD